LVPWLMKKMVKENRDMNHEKSGNEKAFKMWACKRI